jgi:cob(I)alamin adenosyltransferase
LHEVTEVLASGEYDVVVLDEACIAVYYNLFSVAELLESLNKRREETEVIVTGRYAPGELIDAADLVTEMKEIKHYYTSGVEARKGIEY